VLEIATSEGDRSFAIARSSLALVYEYLRRLAEWSESSGRLAGLDPRDALKIDLAGLLLPELQRFALGRHTRIIADGAMVA